MNCRFFSLADRTDAKLGFQHGFIFCWGEIISVLKICLTIASTCTFITKATISVPYRNGISEAAKRFYLSTCRAPFAAWRHLWMRQANLFTSCDGPQTSSLALLGKIAGPAVSVQSRPVLLRNDSVVGSWFDLLARWAQFRRWNHKYLAIGGWKEEPSILIAQSRRLRGMPAHSSSSLYQTFE